MDVSDDELRKWYLRSLVKVRALFAEQEELAPRIGVEMVRLVEVEHVQKAVIARAIGREPAEVWRRVRRWSERFIEPEGEGTDLQPLVSMMERYDRLPAEIDAEVVRLVTTGGMTQADLARELGVSRQEIQRRKRRELRRRNSAESW